MVSRRTDDGGGLVPASRSVPVMDECLLDGQCEMQDFSDSFESWIPEVGMSLGSAFLGLKIQGAMGGLPSNVGDDWRQGDTDNEQDIVGI